MSGWAGHSPVFLDTREIATGRVRLQFRVWISPSEVAQVPRQVGLACLRELVGERSNRFLEGGSAVAGTKANQAFLGPSALGICHNYTISFGAPNLTSPADLRSRRRRGRFWIPTTSTPVTFSRCSPRPGCRR